MAEKKLRLAIVGGGIVGLTFAIALAKSGADVEIDIYEGTAAFSPVGAGMSFWSRTREAMRLLGLEDDLKARTSAGVVGFRFFKADQPSIVQFGETEGILDSYHRSELLDIFLRHIPTTYRTHFGKRLVSYTDSPPDPIVLTFKDGTSATCDILVGSDGVKSTVRKIMYETLADKAVSPEKASEFLGYIKAKWSGQYIYRGVFSREDLVKDHPNHPVLSGHSYFMGKDKHLICYPISQGKQFNFGAITSFPELNGTLHEEPWVTATPQEELKSFYKDWSPDALALLNLITAPSRWAVTAAVALPTYMSGRVAIIGDAAHGMPPHQAAGGGQGVEDGLILATLLAQPQAGKATLSQILQVYDQVRRPVSQKVLQLSHDQGLMMCFQGTRMKDFSVQESQADKISPDVLKGLSRDLNGALEWAWTTSPADDRDRAVELFQALLAGCPSE